MATESQSSQVPTTGNAEVLAMMRDTGAAPDYDKTPPPSGTKLEPMSVLPPRMGLSSVPPHSKQIEVQSIDSYGQPPKSGPEPLVSTNEKALTAPSDKIESINSFKTRKDPLMDEGWDNVGKAGEHTAEVLFPDAMALGKEPVTAEEQTAGTQEANPTEIPPMTPEQAAKIEEATKDAIGPRVFERIMRGDPKNPLQ